MKTISSSCQRDRKGDEDRSYATNGRSHGEYQNKTSVQGWNCSHWEQAVRCLVAGRPFGVRPFLAVSKGMNVTKIWHGVV